MANENTDITMYGTLWCPDCHRAKAVLKRLGVSFTEIDIDRNKEGRQVVLEKNGGKQVVPTILFPDGSILVEPSNDELSSKIIELDLASRK
jgi:glutaredoxin